MLTDVLGSGLPWVEAIIRAFAPYTFVDFHRAVLPAWVARNGHLVRNDLRTAASLAFRSEAGTAYTWLASEDGVRIVEGNADAATVVALTERTFSEFIHDLLTATGVMMTGRAQLVRGDLPGWQRWEPAIRSLYSGREIYGAGVWRTLVDRSGRPLNLQRRFSVEDDIEEMRSFFDTAGYLLPASASRLDVTICSRPTHSIAGRPPPGSEKRRQSSVNRSAQASHCFVSIRRK